MNLPSRLTFYSAAYRLDGGSTTLYATDEHGREHRVFLPREFHSDGDGGLRQTTGRCYFDDEQVPVRSLLESNLLRLFRDAQCEHRWVPRPGLEKIEGPVAALGDDLERLVRGTPDDNLRWLVDSVISSIESDAYGASKAP